ncbi:MAG: hypothetical protein HQL11_01325 [Candidatus Omnitrophica bacterium]|nr:hypothetical protein [Candidatus Omnitrophota bacterium]
MDDTKVRQELYFYFWVGLFFYVAACALNIVHLYQWKGRVIFDFFFHLVLLSVNVSLISQLKVLQKRARSLFLWKYVIFCLVFYPQVLFAAQGTWVYSGHWPHGAFQRIVNLSTFVYEFFLAIYLAKRSVRFVFAHAADRKPRVKIERDR